MNEKEIQITHPIVSFRARTKLLSFLPPPDKTCKRDCIKITSNSDKNKYKRYIQESNDRALAQHTET